MISESPSFHTAIFDALCACVGLNRTSSEAVALIHEAYAEPENVPRPLRRRNVIYWTALRDPGADPVSTAVNAEQAGTGRHTPVVYTTLKYQLIIVCYGPACEEYAHRIRSMLFLDGSGFPRRILRDAGIFPVPDPPQPVVEPALAQEDLRQEMGEKLVSACEAAFDGDLSGTRQGLEEAGQRGADGIREYIDSRIPPPNSSVTLSGGWIYNRVARKGVYVNGKSGSTPLVDTGELYNDFDYEVTGR